MSYVVSTGTVAFSRGEDRPRGVEVAAGGVAIKLPKDVAALLHRLAYETGRSKRDLVIDAIRNTYERNPDV